MNERIRELAVQAREHFLELPTGYTPEQVGMYPQLMEKFAELIVRECAEIARLNTRVDSKVYLMIQEHFGIE